MYKMTSRERFTRIYEHKEADRIPIIDSPWSSTIQRWHKEGMPHDTGFAEYFDLDKTAGIFVDVSPRYEVKTIEETDEYRIYTSQWGATQKEWKHANSTPEFLDFTITSPDKWLEAKERMTPTPDRIPWDYLEKNYKRFREEGYWIEAVFWFGFDVSHSWAVGTERFLFALIENPEWCVDMFNHYLDMCIALYDMIWEKGYKFDAITWPDDMGYKNTQFFSLNMYRELLKPVHKRAIQWAHSKGIKAHLHSCGDINPFVPELIEIGLDCLNPLEVKAGMNPIELKKKYGNDLAFHGGINAVLWNDIDALEEEMRKVIPVMKENGGYIFSTDHSVPSNVSLEDFRRVIELAKELGKY